VEDLSGGKEWDQKESGQSSLLTVLMREEVVANCRRISEIFSSSCYVALCSGSEKDETLL